MRSKKNWSIRSFERIFPVIYIRVFLHQKMFAERRARMKDKREIFCLPGDQKLVATTNHQTFSIKNILPLFLFCCYCDRFAIILWSCQPEGKQGSPLILVVCQICEDVICYTCIHVHCKSRKNQCLRTTIFSLNDDHPCFLSRTSSGILKLVSNSDWGTMTSSDRSSWFWLVWEANK